MILSMKTLFLRLGTMSIMFKGKFYVIYANKNPGATIPLNLFFAQSLFVYVLSNKGNFFFPEQWPFYQWVRTEHCGEDSWYKKKVLQVRLLVHIYITTMVTQNQFLLSWSSVLWKFPSLYRATSHIIYLYTARLVCATHDPCKEQLTQSRVSNNIF